MNYWQIGTGADQRDYVKECLKYGMAFVGDLRYRKLLRESVQLNDCIILRKGTKIIAAGIVTERNGRFKGDASNEDDDDKDWLHDIDGWDLPGYCYVEWHKYESPIKVKGLAQRAFCRIGKKEIIIRAEDIIKSTGKCKVYDEPKRTEKLSDDEMLSHLIKRGLKASVADKLKMTLEKIRQLAYYYYHECGDDYWKDIREHETRSFLIIPLFLALGWSEQQIKIELGVKDKKRIDIACFKRPYRRANDECVLILESKGFGQGLSYASDQGKKYAAHFENCQVVVTSNGYCYKAYSRKAGQRDFEETPSAYLNLLRPRKQYSLDPKVAGGLRMLEYLLPQT